MQQQTENIPGNKQKKAIETGVDMTSLLLDFLSNWKWFVLSVVVCLGIAVYHVSTIIPTYTVKASVYLNDEQAKSKLEALNMVKDDPYGAFTPFIDETEIEILKSRNNLIKIVDSLGLEYSYFRVGRLRDVPLYRNNTFIVKLDSVSLKNLRNPITLTISRENPDDPASKLNIDIKTKLGEEKEEKTFVADNLPVTLHTANGPVTISQSPLTNEYYGTEKVVINNPQRVAQRLSGQINIEFAENSVEILRITCSTDVIAKGEDIIKVLLDFYNRNIIESKNRSSVQTEAFILDRLIMISDELRDVENRLQIYRQENNISDINAQTQMNLAQRNSSEVELAQVDADRSILNAIEQTVTRQDNYQTLPAASNNNALNQMIEAYNKKVLTYENQVKNTTNDHPLTQQMQRDLKLEKNKLLETIAQAKNSLQATRNSIAAVSGRSAGQLASTPQIDKGLQEIFREQSVKVNIYTFLLQKREELALQKTLATPTAQLIDDPSGSGPVAPRRMFSYIVALLIGLAIPGAIIYLKRLLFPNFKDATELRRTTNLPILGEICHTNEKEPIVVSESNNSAIAELFRLLRNNINFTLNGKERKVMLVTSSISGEGKTFISINLAMAYALTGKRVALLGFDLRRPVLSRLMNVSNSKGITSYLSGQTSDIEEMLHQSEQSPNLYILPAGPIPPNPNELIMSTRMQSLIDYLRENFDYIIIDSAPIGLVSDSYLIAPYTDIQIYVARADYTSCRTLQQLQNAINIGSLPHTYLVLNDVRINTGAYSYRRYGYYQSKHTGHGYYNTDTKKSNKFSFFKRHKK